MFVVCVTSRRVLQSFTPKLRNMLRSSVVRSLCENPTLRPLAKPAVQSFGVLLDIDGVLVRGRNAIPGAREALEMLQQSEVPTVYLTNAGSESEKEAAERLSYKIGFEVQEEQMVLSHTPLKMFDWLHNKHVLVSAQGNIKEILQGYGFTNVSDIQDLKRAYPLLDMVDRDTRYNNANRDNADKEFPPIEAVLLLGEAVRWETNLQLIIDLLITNGHPYCSPVSLPKKHIPVIVANTDLIYMSEAPLPRFGHGAFLLSLENLYKKLTGQELIYTEFLGKPYLTSYQYAEYCLNQTNRGISDNIKSLYAVGDNLDTDIYGANLCHEYLKAFHTTRGNNDEQLNISCHQSKQNRINWMPEVKSIESILVQTGVSQQDDNKPSNGDGARFLHRDTVYLPHLRRANHVVENITEAVELILKQEQESPV